MTGKSHPAHRVIISTTHMAREDDLIPHTSTQQVTVRASGSMPNWRAAVSGSFPPACGSAYRAHTPGCTRMPGRVSRWACDRWLAAMMVAWCGDRRARDKPCHHFLYSSGEFARLYPVNPNPDEELRRENEKAAVRALHVRT
jgi:hypothetical protein